MKKIMIFLCMLLLLLETALTGCGSKSSGSGGNADVVIDQLALPQEGDTVVWITVKDYGVIKVHFFPEAAPKAVENFVTHAEEGYYDGVTFHRVIEDFMIQGGDPEGTGTGGESIWKKDFETEVSPGLLPVYGALCMARTKKAVSNGSQFFIVQRKDTSDKETIMQYVDYYGLMDSVTDLAVETLNKQGGAYHLSGGYTVFGQVYEGMDVVEAIAKVSTDQNDMPLEAVVIEKMEVKTYGD